MGAAKVAGNEEQRIETLYSYQILDTMSETSFDSICELASLICDTPIALITLLDRRRQWFKSVVGLDIRETERECSICAHAILDDYMLVIDDLTSDERTLDNRLVLRGPKMRFYAGEPLHAFNGHRLGTLCVIDQQPRTLDPDRKAALRSLARQVEAQLEVRRLNAELARIDSVREQINQFVAHDLATPVTAILLGVDQLRHVSSVEETQGIADEMAESVKGLQSTIADLRDVSIGRAGALAPRYQEIEVGELIDSAVRSAQAHGREREITLQKGESRAVGLEGDANLLQRLVQNLISNALHYADTLVEVSADARDDGRVEFTVDDDGPGIADEHKTGIFDLYARAWDEGHEISRGIGLAFCRVVVEAHAGTIEALDREPRGTRFRVVLPRNRPAPD